MFPLEYQEYTETSLKRFIIDKSIDYAQIRYHMHNTDVGRFIPS